MKLKYLTHIHETATVTNGHKTKMQMTIRSFKLKKKKRNIKMRINRNGFQKGQEQKHKVTFKI